MDRLTFLDLITRFKFNVLRLPLKVPHRYHEELNDHQRIYELSVWWGTGEEEAGVAFRADARVWDGNVDFSRIKEILLDESGYITFGTWTHSRIWDLNDLSAPQDLRAVRG
jgi:hypothetical protein